MLLQVTKYFLFNLSSRTKFIKFTNSKTKAMKTNLLILVVLFLIFQGCRKSTCPEPEPNAETSVVNQLRVTDTLYAVYMTSNKIGYIVGAYGKAYKTIDGGQNWKRMNVPDTEKLNSVYFINGNTGFISSSIGNLYKTTDAGETWNVVPTGIPAGAVFTNTYFENSTTFYIMGSNGLLSNGLLYKTTDGGNTFVQINTGTTYPIYHVYILSNGTMMLACSYATIMRSTDGGNTWTTSSSPVPSPSPYDMSDFYFLSNTIGFSTAFFGPGNGQSIILKTTDGGITWTSISNPDIAAYGCYQQIRFVNNLVGYIMGGDPINQIGKYLKTTDGGATWTVVYSNTERLTDQFILNGTAYCVGFGGTFITIN
jgi:photosystem II stability/assembly factor-like uncharacterized protein